MSDILVEIPQMEYVQLRDLYVHMRTCSTGYHMIDSFINWKSKNPAEDIKFLALNGDWRSDGTFLIILKLNRTSQVYCNTLDDKLKRLRQAFKVLDTKTHYTFWGYSKRLEPALESYIADRGMQNEVHVDRTWWQHAPKELVDTFEVKPPAGITLASLEEKHSQQVFNIWPMNPLATVDYVRQLIAYNVSVGAFDENGNLVAWVLRFPLGAMGILQVTEKFKRRGLGSVLISSLSKKISALGDEVVAPVVITNNASLKLFEKLGFKIVDEVNWMIVPAGV